MQIHHVLPKSYLPGALVEIKSRAASFRTKNRNVDFCNFFFVHSKWGQRSWNSCSTQLFILLLRVSGVNLQTFSAEIAPSFENL